MTPRRPFERWARLATLLFMLFLAFVIVTADTGEVNQIFGFLTNYPNGDMVGHFVLYGLLAFLAALSFHLRRVTPLRIPFTSLAVMALAALEEISQFLVAVRTPAWDDLLAGLAGIILFGETGVALKKWLERRYGASIVQEYYGHRNPQ